MNALIRSTCITVALAAAGWAQAQATLKPDGQWRAVFGAGASFSSGNTSSSNFTLGGDAVKATAADKLSLYGAALYAKSADTVTGEQLRAGGRYDYNLGESLFGFGGVDLERNKFSNLSLRSQLVGGLGWHVLKGPATTWDVFGGLAYTSDKFISRTVIDGASRSSYAYPSLLLGQESTHKFGDTTTARQRLVLYPNLKNTGEYRATWDAGLAVAMSKTMSLTVGYGLAYNSTPGLGRKSLDSLLTTGVSVRLD